MQGSANLNIMMKAARKAARSLAKDFREVENLQVTAKGPGDFVSRADLAAEAILKEELLGARPNYGWLAEEGDEVDGADPTRRWIVDPLDGTTNYLHGMPHWAISIAREHKGEVIGLPFGPRPYLPAALQDLARLLPQCSGVRRWGVASLDLAYVAAGRFDGYWERGVKVWDIAAGLVLVREAGGFVEPVLQGASIFESGGLIAGNNALFEDFRETIRDRPAA